jgi:hypothetical protein
MRPEFGRSCRFTPLEVSFLLTFHVSRPVAYTHGCMSAVFLALWVVSYLVIPYQRSNQFSLLGTSYLATNDCLYFLARFNVESSIHVRSIAAAVHNPGLRD